MKTITKRAVLLLFLMGSILCHSQDSDNEKALQTARLQLIKDSSNYNPSAALATYQQIAAQGNAEAMNGLGLLYSIGIGTKINEQEGIKWFEKSAEKGYVKALYNLGILYKDGVGITKNPTKAVACFEKAATNGYIPAYFIWGTMVMNGDGIPQDYPLALSIFKQGADKGHNDCLYSQGYLYYKGFGCTQNYYKAVQLFELGSQKESGASMYMLGLCYRNGYGITIDNEKAKYWLKKSAALGFKVSEKELAEPEPENANPNQTKTISKTISEVITITSTDEPETFQKVKKVSLQGNNSGNYTGYLLRYDFSGQNIISKTPLQIVLNQTGNQLTGEWKEENGDTAPFTAEIQEDAIVFQDSKIDRLEHFEKSTPRTYEFKEAKLQLLQTDAATFIVGNLQLYNIKERENEKPMYLILEKKQEKTSEDKGLLSSVVIYPNPVISDFNLNFNLAQAVDVTMSIYYITGRELYSEQWKNSAAGQQSKTINLNAPSGYYLLRLTYGSETKTTLLIKK